MSPTAVQKKTLFGYSGFKINTNLSIGEEYIIYRDVSQKEAYNYLDSLNQKYTLGGIILNEAGKWTIDSNLKLNEHKYINSNIFIHNNLDREYHSFFVYSNSDLETRNIAKYGFGLAIFLATFNIIIFIYQKNDSKTQTNILKEINETLNKNFKNNTKHIKNT